MGGHRAWFKDQDKAHICRPLRPHPRAKCSNLMRDTTVALPYSTWLDVGGWQTRVQVTRLGWGHQGGQGPGRALRSSSLAW